MQIKGQVKFIGEVEQVTEKFRKRICVITVQNGQYQDDIATEFVQDNVSKLDDIAVNETVEISINLKSREHNGKWYSSIQGWKIESEL